ncbi:phosphogluconate dehydratase [Methylovulum psychrotolerans]|jgi:phosphogluconate dehydratase|uniref:Phosphogluconate dehydratase n=1 Tax=Methylovulum psychrotolerans TaxID=1704499 RepID=A0A1Z4BZU9_9GAMM|nr:phosphogluconate dehydratase [Methylovulum psychrotolerans]ASF46792.1 phosphogluconate dehydratase [Methylovulum psychrotolerans]MBT9099253.1 phosphogluconate dehydratase [Methylovulum psychrotolerans]POZ50746.1 phosphogluconate dehydratase [Methylovulum psychrotolerans]
MHPLLEKVTKEVIDRSHRSREAYLARIDNAIGQGPHRGILGCGNLAHGFAACGAGEKLDLAGDKKANIAIISSYNDMLSAHEPYKDAPALIKAAISAAGGVAQFAGGVPAMCDGITQGLPGMELSLFSRDVIAMSTAIGLSHNMFDGALYLGVCDKIVPGLLMGALSFGHLPAVFVPAGPMPSGITNKEKARARQQYAEGKIGRAELLESESKSYHSPGTCTFYGTANSNQMMVEMMGLHLPGSSFVNPYTPLRDELTKRAAEQVLKFTALGQDFRPIGHAINEKAILNALIGLLATGGSTNHTMHLVAIARMAGIIINWNDFDNLSKAIPLITKIYPNGPADVNHFQAAGGMGVLIGELLKHGMMHEDILTIGDGRGMSQYTQEPKVIDGKLVWETGPAASLDPEVIATVEKPFAAGGGIHLIRGNLGRGISKVSAVSEDHQVVEAPAVVFDDQDEMMAAFKRGELNHDFVAVLRFQGPRSNGMPELHKLTPALGLLQDKGYKVALLTDGRMSGASGKVPSAIHMYPECINGGPLAKVRNGDIIYLNIKTGEVNVLVDETEFNGRLPEENSAKNHHFGMGREMFGGFRQGATTAETGASNLFVID